MPSVSGTDKFRLNGRLALVTGSSQGIGEALALGLAEAGAAVVINGRDAAKVAKAAGAIRDKGHTVFEAPFDVTDAKAVAAGVAKIEASAGAISILVNNAGLTRRGPLDEITDEAWREVMSTNVDSLFYVSRAVAKGMIARKTGAIINICSVMSELGRPTTAPYTASKGAVKMLTKGMAIDWGKHGIRVNGIGPGYFKTPLNEALIKDEKFSAWLTARTPLGRWGNLDELVGAAVFLASDAASFVTGHVLYVDGGVTASL
jgi:gluconate 5-dehydrogenase